MRLWQVADIDLPEELHIIRDVFLEKPKSDFKPNENLHDYYMRKGVPCFCKDCRKKRKQELQEKNQKLV